ncbi:hypothetical protein TIFTF001_028160 [Ficus carica]|uniref:WAT1-related protein n=1 Tax=Ficus carica TaxID=3494 RepID=A0AA88DPE7_FICCA|nr:hypothetical protein TIFTF001_028160 [Ficus carica]
MAQNLYIESLSLTSATFVTAISNLVPAVTFALAVSFRLEKLNLGNLAGKAKLLGSIIGIGGAMLLTFYRGVEIDIWSTHVDLLNHGQHGSSHVAAPQSDSGKRVWGCVFALGSSICYGLWLILQAKMNVRFPYYFSSVALMSTMGAIQAVGFALCTERDWSQWKLAFYPLMLLLVALSGSLMLNEKLHLGSVLGAVPIVLGLYLVLWGKSEEAKQKIQLVPADSLSPESIEIVVSNPSTPDKNKTCSRDSEGTHRSLEKEHDEYTDSRTQERQ